MTNVTVNPSVVEVGKVGIARAMELAPTIGDKVRVVWAWLYGHPTLLAIILGAFIVATITLLFMKAGNDASMSTTILKWSLIIFFIIIFAYFGIMYGGDAISNIMGGI